MRSIEVRDDVTLNIEEFNTLEDEAGAVVWDAALVLAHWLVHVHQAGKCLVSGKTIIELGAGPGLVGLTAGALGAKAVVLTDLDHLVPYLTKNVKANAVQGSHIKAQELCWGITEHIQQAMATVAACSTSSAQQPSGSSHSSTAQACGSGSAQHPDLILASDVIYQHDQLDNLFSTIATLSGPHTITLLSYEDRDGMEVFHEVLAKNGLSEQEVPCDQHHPDWQSEDIHILMLRKQ